MGILSLREDVIYLRSQEQISDKQRLVPPWLLPQFLDSISFVLGQYNFPGDRPNICHKMGMT